MESQLHHAIAILGRACSTVISAKPIYLDQSLCSGLAHCLKFAAEQLTEVRNEIEWVVQEYPDLFRELNIVACRADVLVERCCSEEWLRILFLQACASHKEDAFDVIDDLEWCMVEIWKISRLPRQQCQSLLKFKESLEECEDSDRRSLSKQLKSHGLVLKEYECLDRRELLEQSESDGLLPLVKRELQLTKYLLGRIEVLGVSSTPGAVEFSLDYRNFYPTVANGFTDSVLVGQGSAAKVYKTKFLGMQCAKKVQTAITAGELQGLAEQASKLAPLSHPHVMKLLGFHADKRTDEGIYEGHWLMECMDGDLVNNIRQYLNQFSTAMGVMLQIAKGVRYLHANGIAHRDLKCGNILVNKSPVSKKVSTSAHNEYFHIKVTDFDQSKFLRSDCSDLQVQSKPNVGSSPWRAPEAFTERGKGSVHLVNPKSADSYSFAMTCFELLSGENPFDAMPGISWTKAKEALIAGRRPSLPEDWPELLRELIAECWRTNPLQRPAFPEICRRLLDVRAFLLTGSLTHRKRQRDAPSFLRHNAQRVFSVFKNVMRMAVTPTREQNPVLRVTMPETQAPFTHADIIENSQQVPQGDFLHKQDHRALAATKVVVGLDFGTTHTGVAYAVVSNPDEIFTISHWPLVGEEVYHCKTLTAIYKSTPNADCEWGYPARCEFGKNVRGNGRRSGSGSYFGELKQSLSSNDFDPDNHQPVVEYLRELGKFVLGYLQHEYPLESLEMDLLRWCITVPSNWGGDSKNKLIACMVNAGLVRGQIGQENVSSSFDMFLESDAAACYCHGYFAHVNMRKGDRLCVLDIGGGNVQCVFEDWEGADKGSYEGTQKVYGARSSCAESLVQGNFLKFLLGEGGCCNYSQLMRDDPSVRISVLDELESLKVDLNHSLKIPCHLIKYLETNNRRIGLQNSTVIGSDELLPSSSDIKFIFKPRVDAVISFLQEQLQSEPNVKRLFVVGGYVKHVYLMEEIRKSFPNLRIDMPKNPGIAVCKGAVALGLKLHFEFQAALVKDAPLHSESGGPGTSHNGGKSNEDNNQRGEKANPNSPSYPRFGNTSDTKGTKQEDSEDQMDVDSLREKMLVALDFGTSQMGFAYGFESHPAEITVCQDDERRTTDLYYKLYHDTLRLHSCGQKVKNGIRKERNQQPDDPLRFVLAPGDAYISNPKLHLLVDNAAPEVELHLPAGLIIDEVISDCLREYGHFILEQLQKKFGNNFKLHHIQWCLLVPSFWSENTKRRMKACMISSGLLRGSGSVDGSPYPLVTVLEAEAASMACIDHFVPRKSGHRFLVASIGAGTLDMVIQEWVGEFGMYDSKEVSTSSGGLYGSSCLDLNFLAFLSMKMGPWVRGYLEHSPLVLIDLMQQWEKIKVKYSDDCELKLYTVFLPVELENAWRRFERQSATREAEGWYELLELTSDDVKMIFEPVVQTILELITLQLAKSSYVDAMVVVGGFAKSPYLCGRIVRKFGDRCFLSLIDIESVVLKGALLHAQHPKGIRSRIARKTCGLGMSTDFTEGVCRTGEVSNEVERFRIDVEKGSCLGVDHSVESYHRPINRAQKSMKFTLYSSVESCPVYTGEQSVTKEWDFVVDISDSAQLEEEPIIRIRLYYGRSAVEVVAEAVNFGNGESLQTKFAVGAHDAKKSDTSVANKTYGVGTRKFFEIWDLPEYHNISVDQGDTCDFSFDIYIQRGSPLYSLVSRTYHPIYNEQRNLSLTLYSSTDVTPRYTTDETAKEEGDFEIDISKGLYLDMDREISFRMYFTPTVITISAVALNFADKNRNLPIRHRYGRWENQVKLTLARQFRIVPLEARTLVEEGHTIAAAVTESSEVSESAGPDSQMSDNDWNFSSSPLAQEAPPSAGSSEVLEGPGPYVCHIQPATEQQPESPSPKPCSVAEREAVPWSRFRGVSRKAEKWTSEIRPTGTRKSVWLGTYATEEEAASAYDAGIFYFDEPKNYNFPDSETYLPTLNRNLDEWSQLHFIKTQARLIAKMRAVLMVREAAVTSRSFQPVTTYTSSSGAGEKSTMEELSEPTTMHNPGLKPMTKSNQLSEARTDTSVPKTMMQSAVEVAPVKKLVIVQKTGIQPQHQQEVKTLWVGDLQSWMDENYLRAAFKQVQSVKIMRNEQTGCGFVEFVSHAAAEKILQAYNGTQMPNTEQRFRLNWIRKGPLEAGPEHTISARAGNLPICDNDTVRLSDVFSHDHRDQRGGGGSSSGADKLLGCSSSSCNSVHGADAVSESNEEDVWDLGIDGPPDDISAEDSIRVDTFDPYRLLSSGRICKPLPEARKPLPNARKNSLARFLASRKRPRPVPVIPPITQNREYSPSTVMHLSQPVNAPGWSNILGLGAEKKRISADDISDSDEKEEEEEKLPPHLQIPQSQVPLFSVCEGDGRTLKGSDLSRVRNAVLRETGFLDG